MSALRILVADDHEIGRRGLCAILESHTGWEVCGEAADGREAVEKTRQLNPDVVILDIGMPSLNGLEATRQILRGNPLQARSDSDRNRRRATHRRGVEGGCAGICVEG